MQRLIVIMLSALLLLATASLLAACSQGPAAPESASAAQVATAAPATATAQPAAAQPTATQAQAASAQAAALPTLTPIPTSVPGVLFVDAGQSLGKISPYVYGTNYGPWTSLRPETLPLADQAGVTIIRWPGGNWGDENTIQPYQLDQFVDLARRMQAEPYIHVRFPDSTPEEAAALVRYANKEKGYNIKFWSIGNEPSLYEKARKGWPAPEFAAEWRKFAQAMKAVDPTIQLLGPEIHQYNGTPAVDPKDSGGRDWLRTFLQVNGDLVDVVSVHRYPFPAGNKDGAAPFDDLMANTAEWTQTVRNLRATVREVTGRDLPVAITELNSHYTNIISADTSPDSLAGAIWLGDVLGRLIKEGVYIANQFILVTDGSSGLGMMAKYEARPPYFVYQLYKQFGDELVYTSSDDPKATIYAAKRPDGALTLMAINLSQQEQSRPLKLSGFTPAGDAQVWRLDIDHKAEQIGTQSLVDGATLTLPPLWMTLYVLEPKQ